MHAKKLLIARIKGGLGNQLYCYAAARRLALKNKAELVLDHVSGFARDATYQRQYRLDGFAIAARLATPSERMEPLERARRGLTKLLQRRKPFAQRSYIEQETPDFDPRLLRLQLRARVSTLDGLWQSAHYFADIEDILRADLQIEAPDDSRNRQARDWIRQHNAVAVHVRWFASSGAAANAHTSYYQNALTKMAHHLADPHYVIFSDNPGAAARMLGLPAERVLLADWNSAPGAERYDLWLMSQCRHFILANSTFSWWGAWLADARRDCMVLFPRCEPANALGWAWDYEGQMPPHWRPLLVKVPAKT